MKGTYTITVQSEAVQYDFTIRRNITIIKGDSATGKSTLLNLLDEYYRIGADSNVFVKCERPCIVLSGLDWKRDIANIQDSIVFIEEGSRFIVTREFAAIISNTNNYYVLVTRERLATLPYSVKEVYKFVVSEVTETGVTCNRAVWAYKELLEEVTVCPERSLQKIPKQDFSFLKLWEKNVSLQVESQTYLLV